MRGSVGGAHRGEIAERAVGSSGGVRKAAGLDAFGGYEHVALVFGRIDGGIGAGGTDGEIINGNLNRRGGAGISQMSQLRNTVCINRGLAVGLIIEIYAVEQSGSGLAVRKNGVVVVCIDVIIDAVSGDDRNGVRGNGGPVGAGLDITLEDTRVVKRLRNGYVGADVSVFAADVLDGDDLIAEVLVGGHSVGVSRGR